jgi:hypothetical protein
VTERPEHQPRMTSLMRAKPVTTAVTVVVLAAVLILPAIWNGFPLVFSDTGVYIGDFRYPGTPPFYGIFVAISSFRVSLFMTVIMQSLILATVITVFILHIGGERRLWPLLFFGLAVVLVTQAPWLASWIMPDALAGAGIIAMSVLLFRQTRLDLYEHVFLLGVVLLAGLCATANVPYYIGYLGFAVAARWILVARQAAMKGTAVVAFMLILAATLVISTNFAIHGRAVLNSASPTLNFSRLADIGLAQSVVRELCESEQFAVCDHVDGLEAYVRGEQNFLWGGIAESTSSRTTARAEYAELVSRIMRERWPIFLGEGLTDSLRLFFLPALENFTAFRIESPPETWVNFRAYPLGTAPGSWVGAIYPDSLEAYLGARQQSGEVLRVFPGTVYAASTFLSYALLIFLTATAWRRGDAMAVALGLAGIAAVVGNLVLHGVLVGPFPRYHAKIGWLGWLFVVTLLARSKADPKIGSPTGRHLTNAA